MSYPVYCHKINAARLVVLECGQAARERARGEIITIERPELPPYPADPQLIQDVVYLLSDCFN